MSVSNRYRVTKNVTNRGRSDTRARAHSPAIKNEHDSSDSSTTSKPQRRSTRNKKPKLAHVRQNLPTPPRSPPASASPMLGHTASSTSCNTRRAVPMNTSYTRTVTGFPTATDDTRQPTVNWDCVSYVVSDQKIQTTYEKPDFTLPLLSASGLPDPNTVRVRSYGKMITKTVTLTQTTTIATTEILHPDEPGYEESVRRQIHQNEANPEERERIERQYQESRSWSTGNRAKHEQFHYGHHRAAQPASAMSSCKA